ncbi:hypothetical protein GCM10027277_13210 [Pseudoduganella ginsengisoli]
MQQRRDDSTGRVIVTRDELVDYGDATVADALRRQPGVTVSGGQVRLRGMGGGRTLLLLNGEPAAPGFSPDSLAPELVERIEIQHGASADRSSQGIAGSINIILRKSSGRARTQVALAGARGAAGWAPEASLDLARPGEDVSGNLAVQVARSLRAGSSAVDERTLSGERRTAESDRARNLRLGLAPRLNWKLGGGAALSWQGLLEAGRSHNQGWAQETVLAGEPGDYPRNAYAADAHTAALRSDLSGSSQLGGAARLEWKAGMAHYRRGGDYLFTGSAMTGQPLWLRRVLSHADDSSASTMGKLRFGSGAGHGLAAGWDGALARRGESRRQDDASAAGEPLGMLDQRYVARVRRLALFVQDEWSPSPALDTYIGLRWEGLRTLTDGVALAPAGSRSSVWSPVAHLLWRVPATRDQLRMALSRSYKAPETRDLVPRRFTVNNGNSAANPDVQGNPQLRPELAWGADGAYETYLGQDSMASVSFYLRRIDGVIQPVLFQDAGKWVSAPGNGGNATARGMQLDWRQTVSARVTARVALSRNWSHVQAIAGPGNRLGAQAPLVANAGLDYRFSAGAAAGLNWNLEQGGVVRTSAAQWRQSATVRKLDVHGSWPLSNGVVLRAAASNVLRPETFDVVAFGDGRHDTRRETLSSGVRTLRLAVEFAL